MTLRRIPAYAQPFKAHQIRIVEASVRALAGYGRIVEDFAAAEIEIVRWPAQGSRPVDPGTGDQGGTTEGDFLHWWEGETYYGRNDAVGDSYQIGWSRDPAGASGPLEAAPDRILVWHANYHPDGGQIFFPRLRIPFVVALARPGDAISPEHFVGFHCDGSFGLYFHPGVWHTPALVRAPTARFADRQGCVHARVSCDFVQEFGLYLSVPL
jgi:hypothetical protein